LFKIWQLQELGIRIRRWWHVLVPVYKKPRYGTKYKRSMLCFLGLFEQLVQTILLYQGFGPKMLKTSAYLGFKYLIDENLLSARDKITCMPQPCLFLVVYKSNFIGTPFL
jgi:hypothetical protein